MKKKCLFLFFFFPLCVFGRHLKYSVEPSISYRFDSIKQLGSITNITAFSLGENAFFIKPIDLEKINRKVEEINLAQVGLMLKWTYNDVIYLRLFGSYGKFFTDPREKFSGVLTNNTDITIPFVNQLNKFQNGQFAIDLESNIGVCLLGQKGWFFYPDVGASLYFLKINEYNQVKYYSFMYGGIVNRSFDHNKYFSLGYHFHPYAEKTIKVKFLNKTSSGQAIEFEKGTIKNGSTYGHSFFVHLGVWFAKRWSLALKYHFLSFVTHASLNQTFGGMADLKTNYISQKIELGFFYTW